MQIIVKPTSLYYRVDLLYMIWNLGIIYFKSLFQENQDQMGVLNNVEFVTSQDIFSHILLTMILRDVHYKGRQCLYRCF